MMTDKYGQIAEKYQYDVWGKAYDGRFKDGLPGWGNGRNDNVYGFTGQRYQPELGVYSFAYRDYSPRTMRWLTEDPVKDGLNWYRYCGGDPINFTDSYGLETWLIHGTWSDPSTFPQEFEDAVGEAFNDTTSRYQWSGENTESARWAAAQGLVNETLCYTLTNPDGPVNYVAHSHGGNVGIETANTLANYGVQVNNLVTMGTPVRGDYQLTGDNVNNHTQIYNPYDFTQVLGGDLFSLPGIGEVGPAGRTFDNANNIAYAYYGNIFNPFAPFTENHSVYYNNPDCYNTWLSQITENNGVNYSTTDDYSLSQEDSSKN
jgi:RHS repeat-associated protein